MIADPGKNRIARFRGLCRQSSRSCQEMAADGRGNMFEKGVVVKDGQAIGKGAGVGDGDAGGDDVEVVADHVGEDQGDQAGPARRPAQLPAFDPRQVLANGVDLVNRCPAGEEQAGRGLFILQAISPRRGPGRGRSRRRKPGRGSDRREWRRRPVRAAPRWRRPHGHPAGGGRPREAGTG